MPTGDINQDDAAATKLWFRNLIGDAKMAEALYSMTGDKFARDLAVKISRTLEQRSCFFNLNVTNLESNEPTIYIVTPTYRRPEQAAELTRLAQTLMHLQNIYWIVVEDAKEKSEAVEKLLKKSGIRFVHLISPYPTNGKFKGSKAKGVPNRIRGLKWIRENVNEGVLYFADDDNTYDIELFKEMRSTKKVSMWPVGLVTQTGVSSPIVKDGHFHGFYDGWIGGRKFPVDMAGFAVNIKFLKQRPKATMIFKSGYEEDSFLQSLAPFEPREIEFKANNCTKILVWHTQTKKHPPSQSPKDKTKYVGTNIMELMKNVV